jgi:hypothetical protein
MEYGNVLHGVRGHNEMPDVQVGDGMTELMWSDRRAYTVVGRSASGKTLEIQGDTVTSYDEGGYARGYERNTSLRTKTVRWSAKRGAFVSGGSRFIMGRDAYYDRSF